MRVKEGKIKNLLRVCARKALRWRFLIILLVMGNFCIFGYWSQYLQMDTTARVESVLEENDPVLVNYKEFERVFGTNNYLVIALETEDVFTNERLNFIKELSERFEELQGVKEVYSLATLYDIRSNIDEDFVVEKFLGAQKIKYSGEELDAIKAYLTSHPLLGERLVDIDGKAALLQIQMEDYLNEEEERILVNMIRNITAEMIFTRKLQITPHFAGDAVVSAVTAEAQKKEEFLYPLMLMFLFVILLLVFRNFFGIVLPLSIVIITMTTILGLKSMTHSPMSTIDPLLYALITAISVGDAVHIISAWYNKEFDIIMDKKEKMIKIMAEFLGPCFLTTITTAVGFGSIAISGIPQIKNFGIYAAIGVLFAFFLTITFIPAVLVSFDRVKKVNYTAPNTSHGLKEVFNNLQDTVSSRIANLNVKYAKSVLVCFGILVIVACFGITQIKTGTNPYSFLKESNPLNVSLHFIEEKISGITDLELIVHAKGDEPFKNPAVLREVEKLQEYVTGLEGITRSDSFLTLLKLINKAMHSDDKEYYTIPTSREMTGQYLLLYEMSKDGDYLHKWVNEDYNTLRINCKVAHSANLRTLKNKIESFYQKDELAHARVNNIGGLTRLDTTGSAVLWKRIDNLFISSQIQSLLWALGIISVIMVLLFKSWKLGIFSLIANLVPILCGLGFLGYFGINLDMGTVMIAPIAIGIAVDDTIHFLTRFRKDYLYNKGLKPVFYNVYKITLKPIIFTSLILAVGFGSNIISNFKPNAHFGIISALTLIVAMLCDLLLLPALIVAFKGHE